MSQAFALTFANPFLLLALLGLPILWRLLRATPPAPREEAFGGTHFLEGLRSPRPEAARTPWPLLALRLLAAMLLIVGLAGPTWDAPEAAAEGPLLLVVDDGWTAAPGWDARVDAVRREAARPGRTRTAQLLLTAADAPVLEGPMTLTEAADRLAGHTPAPRLPDHEAARDAVRNAEPARVLYLPGAAAPDTRARASFLRALTDVGPVTLQRAAGAEALSLVGLDDEGGALTAQVRRAPSGAGRPGTLRVLARDGRVLDRVPFAFAGGEGSLGVPIDLPLALRNQMGRVVIEGERSAGAVWLVDRSLRRVRVGLTEGAGQGLLGGDAYLAEALAPLSVLVRGEVAALVEAQADVIVLDDIGTLRASDEAALLEWLRGGGLLLRFAGPNTAAAESAGGETWPAPLRAGGRSLGGALSWETPQRLGPYPDGSPLRGLATPDVTVRQQVLTQADTEARVWAQLEDGTPLVTARPIGEGLSVLFHVTASPDWSDLPLSGAFPTLLERVIGLAGRSAERADDDAPLPALALLDGFGALAPPARAVPPATQRDIARGAAPPGLYGPRDASLAANTYRGQPTLIGVSSRLPAQIAVTGFEAARTRWFGPWLIGAVLLLLALDALWVARRAGGGRAAPLGPARSATALLVALTLGAALLAPPAQAQPRPPLDAKAVEAATRTRLAYVLTNDASTDALTRQGLTTLSEQAAIRSALEPGPPVGVNIDRDDLSVYPLIYWPLTASAPLPSDAALSRLEAYMAGGGLLVIDTRDGERQAAMVTPEQERLRTVLSRMNTPPLEPLPDGHVLGLSFYRMDDLPGRNASGPVWVEAGGATVRGRDGVPSLIVGGRDWAGAWALDARGRPLRPQAATGRAGHQLAIRSGINMAMVALTGSYKTDQVHVDELLERLGQDVPE